MMSVFGVLHTFSDEIVEILLDLRLPVYKLVITEGILLLHTLKIIKWTAAELL